MDKISIDEFYTRVLSFREKLSDKRLTDDMRRNLLKMLTLSFLNTESDDLDEMAAVAQVYQDATVEYTRRVMLLGGIL